MPFEDREVEGADNLVGRRNRFPAVGTLAGRLTWSFHGNVSPALVEPGIRWDSPMTRSGVYVASRRETRARVHSSGNGCLAKGDDLRGDVALRMAAGSITAQLWVPNG